MGEQLLRILLIKNTANYHALCADLHGCQSIYVSVPRQDSKRAAAADAQMASRSADQDIMGDTRRMIERKTEQRR
jgi:hypothetical protein